MHGSSLIDIVQKPSIKLTSEVSLVDEPSQKEEKQQRLDKKEPNRVNDDWFQTEPKKQVDKLSKQNKGLEYSELKEEEDLIMDYSRSDIP